jgi:SAM-dependent methyltransferase
MSNIIKSICSICDSNHCTLINVRDGLVYGVCRECGHFEKLIELGNTIESEFLNSQGKYFDEYSAPKFSGFHEELLINRKKLFLSYIKKLVNVLEVGPGSGEFLWWLYNRGHAVTAIEHSNSVADFLMRKYSIPVTVGDFEDFNVENNHFDVFCSFHVIEHVRDPLKHLQRAFSAVKLGGLAFIATPNSRAWDQIIPGSLSPNFDSAHLRLFSAISLQRLAETAGWQVIDIQTPEYTINFLRVLTKLIRKSKNEDQEATAGKYASNRIFNNYLIYKILHVLFFPFRFYQRGRNMGSELLIVLRKEK